MQSERALELVLGPHGRRYQPRSIARLGLTHPAWVRVAPEALDAADRSALSRSAFVRHRPDSLDRGLIVGAQEELERLAESSVAARLALATHQLAHQDHGRPRVVGVVNLTPDSFSDGGRYSDPARAIEHALALEAQGADLLDLGAESTRPGAEPVAAAEEWRRLEPVLTGLLGRVRVPLHVDTQKGEIAEKALALGTRGINDTSAGRADPRLFEIAARHDAELVLMHMQGAPRDMQRDPQYGEVVGEVLAFLRERAAAAISAGVRAARLAVDPGLGFGKRLEHNLELLTRLSELRSLGLPVYVGASRKSFIAEIEKRAGLPTPSGPTERLGGSLAALLAAARQGASFLRVHDVAATVQALRVDEALSQRTAAGARTE